MEGIFVIFIFVGVIAITALLFGVWMIVGIFRLCLRGIAAIIMPSAPPLPMRAIGTIQCRSERCRAVNPATARFCRRCGQMLQHRLAAHRAACW